MKVRIEMAADECTSFELEVTPEQLDILEKVQEKNEAENVRWGAGFEVIVLEDSPTPPEDKNDKD